MKKPMIFILTIALFVIGVITMPYVDRTTFTTNDQQSGEVADPNKLESNDSHLADVIDTNYKKLKDHIDSAGINEYDVDSLIYDKTGERIKSAGEINLDYLQSQQLTVELTSGDPTGEASIREHSIVWHPVQEKYYLLADVIPTSSSEHPNSYNTEIHLWSSPDLVSWTYIGVAVEKSADLGEYGVATPTGAVYHNGKIYVPFSARNNADYTGRSIGLAWSGTDPSTIPWTKTTTAISDTSGEDDDPALVKVPGDDRLHLYYRTNSPQYRTVHTSSLTPETPSSWSSVSEVTTIQSGISSQELTAATFVNGTIHLFVSEQGSGVNGIQIAHFASGEPSKGFKPYDQDNRYIQSPNLNLAYGGHFTPVVRDEKLEAFFFTVFQGAPKYGLTGYFADRENEKVGGLFRIGNSATQSIPSDTNTKVNFGNYMVDNDGWFNSSRYTPQKEGYYEFTASAQLASMVDQKRAILEIQRNGTRVAGLDMKHASGTLPMVVSGSSGPIYADGVDDYFEVFIYHNNGASTDIISNDTWTYFAGRYIGKQ